MQLRLERSREAKKKTIKMTSRTTATVVSPQCCIAFKRVHLRKSEHTPRFTHCCMLVGCFRYQHAELCVRVACDKKIGQECVYCKQVLEEYKTKVEKLKRDALLRDESVSSSSSSPSTTTMPPMPVLPPISRTHILCYSSVHKHGVQCRVDRTFDDSYEFVRIARVPSYTAMCKFLREQAPSDRHDGKRYQLSCCSEVMWWFCSLVQCNFFSCCCNSVVCGWWWRLRGCCCRRRTPSALQLSEQQSWYCSQLVAAALTIGGIDGVCNESPDELAFSLRDKSDTDTWLEGMQVSEQAQTRLQERTLRTEKLERERQLELQKIRERELLLQKQKARKEISIDMSSSSSSSQHRTHSDSSTHNSPVSNPKSLAISRPTTTTNNNKHTSIAIMDSNKLRGLL